MTLTVKILSVFCLLLHLWCTDGVAFIYQTRKDCIGRNIENLLLKLKIAMFQRFCCLFLAVPSGIRHLTFTPSQLEILLSSYELYTGHPGFHSLRALSSLQLSTALKNIVHYYNYFNLNIHVLSKCLCAN